MPEILEHFWGGGRIGVLLFEKLRPWQHFEVRVGTREPKKTKKRKSFKAPSFLVSILESNLYQRK